MKTYWSLGCVALLLGVSACSDDDTPSDDDMQVAGRDSSEPAPAGSGAAGKAGAGEAGKAGEAAGTPAAGSGGAATSGPKNIVETAVAAGSFTKLTAAVMTAKLVEALSGAGPFTVFAPTDAAFDAFEKANPGALGKLSVDDLTKILNYHVISGAAVKSTDLKDGQLAKTLAGPVVAVDLGGSKPKVGGATVTMADIEASNGVIHVIDAILIPPKDIIEVATAAGKFTKLAEALAAVNLVNDLKGEGPFTVFAPTDDAFAKLSAVPSGDALKNVLLYHVVSGVAGPLDLKDKGVLTTLSGSPALVETTGGAKIAGAKIVQTNVVASNGVIHVIDSVIVPPADDIAQVATAAGSFTKLTGALMSAGLVDALKAKGPFTVFAPTDAAFAMLESTPSGDALKNVLLYHVVMGAVGAGDLKAGDVSTLLTDKKLAVTLSGGAKVNGAGVTMANIITKNGVIHVIDRVLVP